MADRADDPEPPPMSSASEPPEPQRPGVSAEGWEWYPRLAPAGTPAQSAEPARELRPAGTVAFVVALIPAAFGWMMLVVLVMLIGMSGHLSCTAHRGETYRRCVRDDDLGSLELQGQILGLAVAAFALVLVGLLQSRSARCLRGWGLGAMIAAGSLLAASLLGWILGVGGLWAPDRPLPYDPVSVARGSGIMLGGAVRGLMVGALVGAAIAAFDRLRSNSQNMLGT